MTYNTNTPSSGSGEKKGSEFTDIIREAAPDYACKRQGEYTLEDYYALPDNVRAELMDGEMIIMEAPNLAHQVVLSELFNIFANYIKANHGSCIVLPAPLNVQLDCDDRTMLQPDISVICKRDKLIKIGIYGAPDLVIEISSPSTRRYDSSRKLVKYIDAGVREFWIVDLQKQKIIVHHLEADDFPVIYTFDDQIPVRIYDGSLTIDMRPIRDMLREMELV